MRLRTTCRSTIIDGSTDDFAHDAAMAHALTQAIAEARNHCHGSWDTCDFIRERADEIMREWGYEYE